MGSGTNIKKNNFSNIATICSLCSIVGFFGVIIVKSLKKPDYKYSGVVLIISGYMFIMLGVAFAVIGVQIINALKIHFRQFYQDNKKVLIIATLGLSLPLVSRGAINLGRGYNLYGIEKSILDNNIVYDSLFLCADIIEIWMQLLSLIFGYIRK